jgi:hypothetical protein
MPFINLQGPAGVPMGTVAVQSAGSLSPSQGDTLPVSPTNRIPISTGAGWQMVPAYCGAVVSTVTVTNSYNVDFSAGTIFQYWVGAANQTFQPLFVSQTPGQTIRLVTTQPAASINGQILWPAGSIFVGGTKILSSVTGGVDVWDITCISQSTFYGNRLAALA